MAEKKKHKLEVEEDHDFFDFFLDLVKRRKEKEGDYHGFKSKKVYLAFKKQWGKPHHKKGKKKARIEFESTKELEEAEEVVKQMKESNGIRQAFDKIKDVESLDGKIEKLKQMLKRLEQEKATGQVSEERHKAEYMEFLEFLKSKKKKEEKAVAEEKQVKKTAAKAKPAIAAAPAAQAAEKEPAEPGKEMASKIISLQTPIDKFAELLRQNKKMSFQSLAAHLGWSIESVERVGLVLEKRGIVDVHYPALVTSKPFISFVKELPQVPRYNVTGKLLEKYSYAVDFVPARVEIYKVKAEQRPVYHVVMPYVGAYTMVFFDELKDDIAEQIPIEASEITDTKKGLELKKRFFAVARKELQRYLSDSPARLVDTLAGLLLHTMYGLGEIEVLMGDNKIEEVAVNSAKSPITVYHQQHGWMQTTVFMQSEDEIFNYASQIGRKVGRNINTLNPILDAHLISGDRVSATLSPISTFGNTLTIRRFSRRPWTIVDFIGKTHTLNLEMASLLWMAMQYEMSIVIAGGTASGKTSCLNALAAMIPSYHRTISIEDVREIMLPGYMHWNWVPLTTRNPNPEGMGEVSMLNLMQSSLRMRPDRIILGEIRRRKEAEVLFEAMHTGHSVYSTLHADNSQQVLRRLTEPPISLPALEVEAIDLLLVQYRDRRKNMRRTYEISEIESAVSGEQLSINIVFKWDPRTDEWETVNPATKFIRQLNLHTGMTEDEITKDLESRASILQWAMENDLNDISGIGNLMKLYYSNQKRLEEAAKKNEKPESVFGDSD